MHKLCEKCGYEMKKDDDGQSWVCFHGHRVYEKEKTCPYLEHLKQQSEVKPYQPLYNRHYYKILCTACGKEAKVVKETETKCYTCRNVEKIGG